MVSSQSLYDFVDVQSRPLRGEVKTGAVGETVMNAEEGKVARFDEEDWSLKLSDEQLEALARTERTGVFTLAACTGLSACPA